jgi:hypothetical protein
MHFSGIHALRMRSSRPFQDWLSRSEFGWPAIFLYHCSNHADVVNKGFLQGQRTAGSPTSIPSAFCPQKFPSPVASLSSSVTFSIAALTYQETWKPQALPSFVSSAGFSTSEAAILKEALHPPSESKPTPEKADLGQGPKYKVWKVTQEGAKTEEEIAPDALVRVNILN